MIVKNVYEWKGNGNGDNDDNDVCFIDLKLFDLC